MDTSTRFWLKVHKTADCWLWQGATNKRGYGRCTVNGVNWYSHRLSWMLHYGAIPVGMFVLHHCDNPSCVRPDHLFLGTQTDNMKDCVRKRRHAAVTHPECIPTGKRSARRKHPKSWSDWVPPAKLNPELVRGQKNPAAKLTDDDVRSIRRLYATGEFTQARLAKQFKVGQTAISNILLGRRWAHVT